MIYIVREFSLHTYNIYITRALYFWSDVNLELFSLFLEFMYLFSECLETSRQIIHISITLKASHLLYYSNSSTVVLLQEYLDNYDIVFCH